MASVLADDERLDDADAGDDAAARTDDDATGTTHPVHRLRDLDRRQRWIAGAFVAALVMAPVFAFVRYLPEWIPAGDPAYMGLRAMDVGTSRTPLMGQPSTAADYVGGEMVHHLGPSHFYILAPFMRIFGPVVGMLLVSVLLTGGSVLLAAWAVLRQLGAGAAAVAAVALGTITFTTGASSLVNPVSSSIAGYPLLLSAVLLWCLLCGDLRLLPLTAFVVSFTAQQHLAVLPALAVMTAAGVAGCLVLERRRGRELARWAGLAAGVAALTWSPVVLQQLFGAKGNLSLLLEFAGHSDRPKLGMQVAFRQVVHALGVPPLLGQTHLDGTWFFGTPSLLTSVTAGLVVAALAFGAWRWVRSGDRRRVTLVVLAVAAAVGGLLNGSSVPAGIEQFRLPFYHWAFVLNLFVVTALVLLAAELVGGLRAVGSRWAAAPWLLRSVAAPALGVLLVAVPAVVNPTLDRRSNTLLAAYTPVERDIVHRLSSAVVDATGDVDGPIVLLGRGEGWYNGLRESLTLDLIRRGIDVEQPRGARSFVHDHYLANRSDVAAGLILVIDKEVGTDTAVEHAVPGDLLIDVDSRGLVDWDAFEELVAQGESVDEVVFGSDVDRMLADLPSEDARTVVRAHFDQFAGETASLMLGDPANLRQLLDTPLEQPAYDPDLIRQVLETLPEKNLPPEEQGWRLRVYLLDRDELLDWSVWELYP